MAFGDLIQASGDLLAFTHRFRDQWNLILVSTVIICSLASSEFVT
jgi:hypothetical protein